MDWIALLKTIGLCLLSILIEAASATKDGKAWFENLKQPSFSFPFSVWYLVGGLYYLICGVIAYRIFHTSSSVISLPIILLALMMLVNGLTNVVLFKLKSPKMFYWSLYPFLVLLIGLMVVLFPEDKISFGLASLYFLWLCYDLYYFRTVWKINEPTNAS
jgi:tryptophan-rich sensory protein